MIKHRPVSFKLSYGRLLGEKCGVPTMGRLIKVVNKQRSSKGACFLRHNGQKPLS